MESQMIPSRSVRAVLVKGAWYLIFVLFIIDRGFSGLKSIGAAGEAWTPDLRAKVDAQMLEP